MSFTSFRTTESTSFRRGITIDAALARAAQLHGEVDKPPYGGPGLKALAPSESRGVAPFASRSRREPRWSRQTSRRGMLACGGGLQLTVKPLGGRNFRSGEHGKAPIPETRSTVLSRTSPDACRITAFLRGGSNVQTCESSPPVRHEPDRCLTQAYGRPSIRS